MENQYNFCSNLSSDVRTLNWSRGVVIKVLDEMIYWKPEDMSDKYAEWIEVDNNNLARDGTHVKERSAMMKDVNSSDDSPIKLDSDEGDP